MILVVGAGRSGTTATSRVLQEKLGVDMGGPGRKHPSNPDGDYENRRFRNEADAPFHRGEITEKEWRQKIKELANEMEEPWGFKDPRNAHFLSKILDIFPDAYLIWAQREFKDIVGSWMKWYNSEESNAAMEISARLDGIRRALGKHNPPCLKIDFTEWVDPDDLSVMLYTWLTEQGQQGLVKPEDMSG